jgi:hypothetical protein
MSTPKDRGDLMTDLEESLRTIGGVAAVLLKIGQIRADDSEIFSFLGIELSEQRERAQNAFEQLNDLMHKAASGGAP